MSKRVVLKLTGTLEQGFQVILDIGLEGEMHFTEQSGSLPPALALAERLFQWQQDYHKLTKWTRITFKAASTQIGALSYGEQIERCRQSANALVQEFRHWLRSETFLSIEKHLRTSLSPGETIRLLIRSLDQRLHRLPWHLWDFVEDYPRVEVAFGTSLSRRTPNKQLTSDKIRILAILGDSSGIDVEADRALLESLPDATIEFLVEPSLPRISRHLWEQHWDILFFAGHSQTEAQRGCIFINAQESLSIEDLKLGLKRAINNGLKLAIFNSCDGLGLAYELEALHLPQLIVMREPIPDRIAQAFLTYLLVAYASGQSLYLSARQARERLQEEWEPEFPCAGWLPVIFQNPVETPPTWPELLGYAIVQNPTHSRAPSASLAGLPALLSRQFKRGLRVVLLASIAATLLVFRLQQLGWLEPLELKTFDQMMVLRPAEKADPRILIVEVTEDDIRAQREQGERLQRVATTQDLNQTVDIALSDRWLKQVLQQLLQYEPRIIGLDIYRDFPVESDRQDLANYFQTQPIIAICKAEDYWDQTIPTIDPPPEIPLERVGFADFQTDPDHVLRRQFLKISPERRTAKSRCNVSLSFSAQVAFQYLQKQGVTAQITEYDGLRLGQRSFNSLRSHQGGYQKLSLSDEGVSHILLNYRNAPEIAIKISVSELLNRQIIINSDYIKDKIVLIGVTAPGDDYWSVPDGLMATKQMSGVVIQAHMVSQLVSAALDQRPLIGGWPQGLNLVWTLVWTVVGSLVIWQWGWRQGQGARSLLWGGILTTVIIGILSGVCYGLLLSGSWVPLVPPVLGLLLTSSVTGFYLIYQTKRFI